MKTGISIAIIVAIVANCVIGLLIFKNYAENKNNDTSPLVEAPQADMNSMSVEKRILVADLPLASHDNNSSSTPTEVLVDMQLAETEKLYETAQSAGTIVSDAERQMAWQRELYNHNGAEGLKAHITSLGVNEATYRAEIEKQLLINAYLKKIALPYVTDDAVHDYYDSLPESERDEFILMEPTIRQTILALTMTEVRKSLLNQ